MFRSVVLPLKAIVMNSLSLLASYGALVVIFQNGFGSDLLRFRPLGFVEASLPIVLFCVLFGLSMDYHVFLLTRIRERFMRDRDNDSSVEHGIGSTARLITGAALLSVLETDGEILLSLLLCWSGSLYRHGGVLLKVVKFALEIADLAGQPMECHSKRVDGVVSVAGQLANLPAHAPVRS